MKKDKTRTFILEISLLIFSFFALFALNTFTRKVLALIVGVYAIVVSLILKRKKISSINKKQVTILMLIFAILYLVIFYLLGFYFGFVKNKIAFSLKTIFNFILPIAIIIISSEWIRKIFLSNKLKVKFMSKKIDISIILTYVIMVIIDLLIYTEIYNLAKLDDILTLVGFVFFASLSCNLLFNYITNRFGIKGIVIFRLITILFVYIFPVIPNVYILFRTFLRMLYPYIIYLIFEKLYSKNDYNLGRKEKKKEIIGNTFLLFLSIILIMLISCNFKYGIIVVGSESMTGTLNKGDAIIFEKYNNQEIKNGQVIIFEYNGVLTIHRIVDIKRINGEYRYFTRGDANKTNDDDYRTINDIYALVNFRIKYIGYPTLWVRNMFS